MVMSFTNLHSHDCFSRLDGYGYPEQYIARAKELGITSLAQTNHGVMFGSFAHYKACKEAGIKPIIGMEAYLSPEGVGPRERAHWGDLEDDGRIKSVPGPSTHITLLAQNAVGLRNLYRLHSYSFLQNHYQHPRVSRSALREHSEGLIVLSGCAGSELSLRIRLNQMDEAMEVATFFRDAFPGRFWVETMDHGLPFEPELNEGLCEVSIALGIPAVATQDTHYAYPQDARVHEAMLCIQTGTDLSDPKRFKFSNDEFYLKSAEDMLALNPDNSFWVNAVLEASTISDMIEPYDEVFAKRNLMPKGDPNVLADHARRGLERRGDLASNPAYIQRMNYELSVIENLGYSGYFLCLEDIVGWAKRQGIFVGNGRGSGGASLVAYALEITNIDPIEHDLLFERFLNPERLSSPDIDTDVESARRQEVIDYIFEKYGEEYAAYIITFGTIATKRSLQDAVKILGQEVKEANRLKGMVPPPKRGRTLALKDIPELRKANSDAYNLALGLENQIRDVGIHAGGIVISSEPLRDVLPVKRGPNDPGSVVGYDMHQVEDLGLTKLDVLGIQTLDILKTTLGFIHDRS